MSFQDRDEKFQIRLNKEERSNIEYLSNELNETMTETLIKSVELRKEILNYIYENELDDENPEQMKDLVLIIINSLKIT